MSKTNIRFDRERFEKALNYYGSKGLKPQTAELRLEAEFVKGNGVYSFEVNREGAKRLTETLLKRNDLFVVKGLFVGLMVETIGKEGHAPILSYPLLQRQHYQLDIRVLQIQMLKLCIRAKCLLQLDLQ